jgi:polypyrimidine tract-binding protein 2
VFSAFGAVQKIAMFEKNGGMQALIQYPGICSPVRPTGYALDFGTL